MRKKEILLVLIHKLQKKRIASRRAIVKCMFLLKKEYDLDNFMKFYSFYPYKQGPFSQMCFADLRSLKQDELINNEEVRVTELGVEKLSKVSTKLDYVIDNLLERFDNEEHLLSHVYSNYPEYTTRSELIEQTEDKEKKVGYYTIGYEQRDIDNFLDTIIQNNIDTIVDVRKNAFSMNFSFSKKKLDKYSKDAKIEYIHIPELGIESEDRKELSSREDYLQLFKKYRKALPLKEEYLKRVIELGMERSIALLCFEKDVSYCHRGEIAKELRNRGYTVADL